MYKLLFIVAISILLFSCTQRKTDDKVAEDQNTQVDDNGVPEGFSISGDSLILPSFEITVELSGKAEKKLSKDNETIIVRAYLSGTPKDSAPSLLVDEMGQINLGTSEIELNEPGTAVFKNVKVAKKTYDALSDKDFEVLVNVFSGRRSSELNLINCEILEEPVSAVRAKKHVLKGKLIEE